MAPRSTLLVVPISVLLLRLGSVWAAPLASKSPVPVVIWHGLGDSFTNPGLTQLSDLVKERYPDTFVHLVSLADTGSADSRASFFGNANEQVEKVCEQLADIKELKGGFDGVGFSQGGQLMRAYVERCNDPPVRNLITVGSQHLGVSETPPCKGATDFFCLILKRIAEGGTVYGSYAQHNIVPAQYFRDQSNIDKYLEHNEFLRDINNERVNDEQPDVPGSEPHLRLLKDEVEPRNATYKTNFESLHRFVMFKFTDDKTVIPSTSAWFTLPNITASPPPPLQPVPLPWSALPLYTSDYIGLKKLDDAGKVKLGECQGEHMQINEACWEDVMDHLGDGKRRSPGTVQGASGLVFQGP